MYELSKILYHKYLSNEDPDLLEKGGLKFYSYYLTDSSETAIIRIVSLKEGVKDVMQEARLKNLILCMRLVTEEEFNILSKPDCGILYCTLVDQYYHKFSYPFFMPIFK